MEVGRHARQDRRTARVPLPVLPPEAGHARRRPRAGTGRRSAEEDRGEQGRADRNGRGTLGRHRVRHGHAAHQPRVRLAAGGLHRIGHLPELLPQLHKDGQPQRSRTARMVTGERQGRGSRHED